MRFAPESFAHTYTHTHIHTCARTHTHVHTYTYIHIHTYTHTHTHTFSADNVDAGMGWLRLVGSIKLQVSFAEYSLFYMSLLQKRHII